jgi:hypothetical protein
MPRRSRSRKSLRGGNANTLPMEYFGGDSGNYHVDSGVNQAGSGAYGDFVAQSFGEPFNADGTGPNMFVHPNSSGSQTGGRRRRSRRSRISNRSNRSKRSRRSSRSRRSQRSQRSQRRQRRRQNKRSTRTRRSIKKLRGGSENGSCPNKAAFENKLEYAKEQVKDKGASQVQKVETLSQFWRSYVAEDSTYKEALCGIMILINDQLKDIFAVEE